MTNIQAMSHRELINYVLTNRHDRDALVLLMAQAKANPNLRTYPHDRIETLMKDIQGG